MLLHGGGQNRHAWKGTCRVLADHGWFVTAVDLRGHGDSDWPDEAAYEIDDFGEDVLAVISRFDHPPAVVGASIGGLAALAAQRYTLEQIYAALVLVDITPRLDLTGLRRIVELMLAHPDGFATLDDAAAIIAAYTPHRRRPTDSDGLRKVLRQRADGRWHWRWDLRFISSKAEFAHGDPDGIAAHTDALRQHLLDAARRLRAPTLLVRGALSDIVSVDAVAEFRAAVPHAAYVDVSDAGHMVAGDRNDVFTDAVVRFLDTHLREEA